MRSGPNSRRPMRRGGGNSGNSGNSGRRGGSPRSQNFESNGPDIKVRGNAQQIVDKYQTLAREAATAGNPVMAENYYQHAEHYFRVMSASDNRQNNRQADGDDNRNHRGGGNNQHQPNGQTTGQSAEQSAGQSNGKSNGQSNGQSNSRPAEDAATAETAKSAEAQASAEVAAVTESAATVEKAVVPQLEAVAEDPGAGVEAARKSERKRASKDPKQATAADDEPVAVIPTEAAPAPGKAQPAAESTD